MGKNDCLCQFFSVGLVPAIMFDLDVQVERTFTAVNLLAVLVGADVLTVNLLGSPAIVLFSSRRRTLSFVMRLLLPHNEWILFDFQFIFHHRWVDCLLF